MKATQMRIVLQCLSWLALAGIVAPSLLFLAGRMDLDQVKGWMLFSSVVWFSTSAWWMRDGGNP